MSEKYKKEPLQEGIQAASSFCYLCEQIKDSDTVALQLLSRKERQILKTGEALLAGEYARLGLNQEATPMDFRAQIFDEVAARVSGFREVTLKHTSNVMALIDKALSE